MKTAYCKLPFFIVLSALLLVACRKDVQLEHKTPSVKETKMEVMTTTAHFEWTVDYPGAMRSVVKLSRKEDMSDATSIGNDSISTHKVFFATASDLTIGTKYYYCYYTWNPMVEYTSEVKCFTTNGPSVPTVTASVTNINNHSVIGVGKVVDDGNATVTKRGFCWSKSHNPTTSNSHISDGTGTGVGQFTAQINGLEESTTYYLRAYAVNSKGTGYSEEVSFKTFETTVPTVNFSITDIGFYSATGTVTVTHDGYAEVTERGVCWGTSHNPDTGSNFTHLAAMNGESTLNIMDLNDGTTYYARAYAINSKGTGYSEEVSFTTLGATTPTVNISINNIGFYSATGIVTVIDDGNSEVTERGICWGTSHNPDTGSSFSHHAASVVNNYSVEITGLNEGTVYYARAYAINSKGTGYSEEVSFTTLIAPGVTTALLTKIGCNYAICGGTVTSGDDIIARGVCWSTSSDPTIADSHTNDGIGLGDFVSTMMELTPNTTYYVRAYATCNNDIAYGNQRSFITETPESSSGSIGGHDYVDLGLPSGLLWATCNVGAGVPEGYGDHFAWGETQPKDYYGEDNYQFINNPTILLPEDDAATANWGSGWRMPTYDDWVELCQHTTNTGTIQNGVNGYLFTGNCGSLFLPAAGYRDGSSLYVMFAADGNYWSSSLYTDYSSHAWGLNFSSGNYYYYMIDDHRYFGRSVRPVHSGQD